MLADRLSSSNFRSSFIALAALVMPLLAACSQTADRLSTDATQFTESSAQTASKAQAASGQVNSNTAVPVPPAQIAMAQGKSQWCRYLKENAAADATVVRSPSLNGSVDDKGRASLGLGLSLTSMMKADLLETSADAKCRRYLAEKGLKSIVLSAPAGLSVAGYRAKANTIFAHRSEIERQRKVAAGLLADGTIDQQHATAINILADQLIADAEEARSQADMRSGELLASNGNAKVLGSELLKAESELSEADSKMRTYDALDLSVRAGWNDDVNNQGVQVSNNSLSGKLTFSMKLGAASPGRFDHERSASEARLQAVQYEEGSPIWQANELRKAYERSLGGLRESQAQVNGAWQRAQNFVRQLEAQNNPEFDAELAGTRLQLIRLESLKAGVNASMSEVQVRLASLGE
jgi:hypothetical protein